MIDRIGDWMQTAHGRAFWPLDPRVDEVHLDDIAHALANQCRFAGHCREFYSVAQHSILVSLLVPQEFALWGLLHDAAEAYLVDLPLPVKRSPGVGPAYAVAEAAVMKVIVSAFGLLPTVEPPEVKEADSRILLAEARDIMASPPMTWRESGLVVTVERIEPWVPKLARSRFIGRFDEIQQRRTAR